jgi:hypothetical protein
MPRRTDNPSTWSAGQAAAMVGADPARFVAQHVEGPTLLDRELPFVHGIAAYDRAPTCVSRSSPASVLESEPGRSSAAAATTTATSPKRRRTVRRAVGAGVLTLALALVAAGCGAAADPAAVDPAAASTPTPDASATTGTPVAATTTTDPTTGAVTTTDPTTGAVIPATATAGATGATTSTATADEDVPGVNEISGTEAAGGAAIKISKLTPKEFVTAHCAKPIVVVLHQPDSILDQELLSSVKSAIGNASKTAKKDTVLLVYTPADVKKFGDLPAKVGLLSAPGVAVINRGGAIQNFWTGYVDESLIRRVLEIASATKPCKVANEDAGAAAADPSLGAAAQPASSLATAATIASGGTPAATTPAANTGAGDIDSEKGNVALKLLR